MAHPDTASNPENTGPRSPTDNSLSQRLETSSAIGNAGPDGPVKTETTGPEALLPTRGTPAGKAKGAIDFRLVLAMLEKNVLAGSQSEKCNRVLSRPDLWRRMPPELALPWARLAQMAGEIETSLEVLAWLNQSRPEIQEAWEMRIEVLQILDRRPELARVTALRRHCCGGNAPKIAPSVPGSRDVDPDLDIATRSFAAFRGREAAVGRYMELFSGREDAFARQWADKGQGTQGYVPVRRALSPEDVADHLAGRMTYGIYLIRSDATVKTAVLDADLKSEFRGKRLKADDLQRVRREQAYLVERVKALSHERGLSPLLELSGGKGFHFWYFFLEPVPAGAAKALLSDIRTGVAGDLSTFDLEVFPKQDRLSGKGFGNLVKLPLGIHRLSGKPSFFPLCKDRSVEAQLAWLEKVRSAAKAEVVWEKAPVTAAVLPLSKSPRAKPAADFEGEFPELEALCRACPPIGQIVAGLRAGHLGSKEEKVLLQTLGFLPSARAVLHGLMAALPDYNPHLVDYRLSGLRGSPLGCKRIHTLLGYEGPFCRFENPGGYDHPLRHVSESEEVEKPKAETVENLNAAIENLKIALRRVERFLM